MKVTVNRLSKKTEEPRLTRLRYEPEHDKYILAYSDEDNPRVAEPSEVGVLANSAIRPNSAPAGALSAPIVAQIAVTRDCNLTCKFCYAELSKYQTDFQMSTDQVKTVIDQLHEQGVVHLEWAGGEPLMRDDFIELMCYAHALDFKQAVITNATHFSDEYLKQGLKCLRSVQVSIDDIGEHYDNLKGGPWFEILKKNIRRGLAAGLPMIASNVITDYNVERLEDIVHFIWEIGFKRARICWQIPLGDAKDQSLDEYRDLVSRTVKRARALQREYVEKGLQIFCVQEKDREEMVGAEFLPREYLLCSAGRTRLHIDWNGDAYACPLLKYDELKAGNVIETSTADAWKSMSFDSIREVKNGEACTSCQLYCGYWCRAITYGFTRDMGMTPSPVCHHEWKNPSTSSKARETPENEPLKEEVIHVPIVVNP